MIEVHQLTQTYPSGRGVFSLDFSIPQGEVFGYLGPNGAGKTTTIRALLGFTNPQQGTALIDGISCRKNPKAILNRVGYLPGEIAFFDHMSGTEFLDFMIALRRIPDKVRLKQLLDRFELNAKQKISKMSKGMKQKLGIVAAFMHDPDVYLLDEPTSGLDPFMQNLFMDLLDEEKQRGKTVMLSSHIFEEVQRSCSRAGIVREGRIVAIEDVDELNSQKRRTYTVTFADEKSSDLLLNHKKLTATRISGSRVQITVGENLKLLFQILADLPVVGFVSEQQSLEDVFMKYYGKGDA